MRKSKLLGLIADLPDDEPLMVLFVHSRDDFNEQLDEGEPEITPAVWATAVKTWEAQMDRATTPLDQAFDTALDAIEYARTH